MNTPMPDQRLTLITGASRGLGRAAALALSAAGDHVIAVARTEGGLTELDDEIRAAGATATLVPLDLGDYDGIDRLAATIHERWGRLDSLIGNAALLGPLTPLGHIDPDDWAKTLDINLTANWRLIRAFDPLLRASPAGRALFVTSSSVKYCRAYWGPYSITKAALDALAKTYANEVAETAVRINLLNPGPARTAMRASAMPGEDPNTLPTPEDIAPHFVAMTRPEFERNGVIYDYEAGNFIEP